MNINKYLNMKTLSLEHNNPLRFVHGPWRQKAMVHPLFLIYRVSIALITIGALSWSLITYWNSGKWFIYLTHWCFFMLSLETVMGAVLVLQAYTKQKTPCTHNEHSSVEASERMPILYKLHWMVYNMVLPNTFSVTITYWMFVYNPENKTLKGPESLNYVMHGGNSVIAFLELVFAGPPSIFFHVVQPLAFDAIYMIFNFIYCTVGGTDPLGQPWVYKMLNWKNVKGSMLLMLSHAILLVILHIGITVLSGVRSHVARRLRRKRDEVFNGITVPMLQIKPFEKSSAPLLTAQIHTYTIKF